MAFVLVARGAAGVRRPHRLVAVGGPGPLEGSDPEPVEPTVNTPVSPVRENDVSAVPRPSFDAADLPDHRPPLDVALAALENIERGEAELRDLRRERPRPPIARPGSNGNGRSAHGTSRRQDSPRPLERTRARRPAPDPDRGWSWAEPWSFEVSATPGHARNGRVSAPARERRRRAPRERRAAPPLTPRLSKRTRRLRPLGALALLATVAGAAVGATPGQPAPPRTLAAASWARPPRPSAYALQTIPAKYLHIYWRVAEEYGLDWTKLAAVGKIESDHGRLPAAGVASGTNRAGAAGPAQFTASTWARFGVDANGSGVINPYEPVDAITAMAAYLKASGAPQHWRRALYTYNHSTAYVRSVMTLSHRFLGARITPR